MLVLPEEDSPFIVLPLSSTVAFVEPGRIVLVGVMFDGHSIMLDLV